MIEIVQVPFNAMSEFRSKNMSLKILHFRCAR